MKQISPAADRNKAPILESLTNYLQQGAHVLEIASGTGQHAEFICTKRPDIIWQPTDPDPSALLSIEEFRYESALPNFRKPVKFDTRSEIPASINQVYDALVNINMIHISPWEACLRLFEHAQKNLKPGGTLFLYGPFWILGEPPAPSNQDFDRTLKERNPLWGIRNLEDVSAAAGEYGFERLEIRTLPANNHAVIFQKRV